MERPIYVGFTVLELSKLCMYQFYYDILKEKYGGNVELGAYQKSGDLIGGGGLDPAIRCHNIPFIVIIHLL